MSLVTALESGLRLPVRRPTDVLPFYLLATAAATVARVPLLVGGGVALWILTSSGRLQRLMGELERLDGFASRPNPDDVSPELVDAVVGLFPPSVVAVVLLSLFVAVVVGILARGVAAAAALNAVYAALEGATPLTAGVAGAGRDWRTFVGLELVRIALLVAAFAPLAVGIVVAAGVGPAGLLVVAATGLLSIALAVAVSLLLAFVGQAVVVDGADVAGALGRSAGFPLRRPLAFAGYVGIGLVVVVGSGLLASALGYLGVSRLIPLVTALLVAPAFDGFATSLYAETSLPEREAPAASIGGRVAGAFGDGLRRTGAFVRTRPGANLAALVTLAAGVAGGWAATASYPSLDLPGMVDPFGPVPIDAFVTIAANNWLVAAGLSFGGLALGVPTAVSLLFNGALIGGIAGVVALPSFLAYVVPHGVVEVPAIVVAGGLGFHLGRVGWGAARGRRSADSVGVELRDAFLVLLGLAVLFVVAAFVEAFLTPRIAAFALGGAA